MQKSYYKYLFRFIGLFIFAVFLISLSTVDLKASYTTKIDLSSHISIQSPTEISKDFNSQITITNENDSGIDGRNAEIEYHIPASSTYNGTYSGTDWSCDSSVDSDGNLTCTYGGSLNDGETSSILTVVLTAPSSIGSETGTVTVSPAFGSDGDTSNNTSSATVEYGKSNLHISKSVSSSIVPVNENYTYTITVSNPTNGTNPTVTAKNVSVSDTLPSGVSFVSLSDTSWCSESSGTITCSGEDIAPDTSKSVVITVKATSDGTIINTASATTSTADYNSLPINASATTVAQLADVVVTQTLTNAIDNHRAAVDHYVTFSIHVANNGASTAYNVVVTDTLPSGVTYHSFEDSEDWNCDTSSLPTITCTLIDTNLTNGESYDLDIKVKTPPVHGQITNTATATTTSSESDTSNNINDLLVDVIGTILEIEKTPDGGNTNIGTNYTYTIKVSNPSDVDAKSVTVTDTLDPDMVYVSDSQSCSVSGQTLTCDLGDIDAHQDKSFTVTVQMPDDAGDVTNSADVATVTDMQNTDHVSDTAITHVLGPNLNIVKSTNVSHVGLGKTFTYTLHVTNGNTADADDGKITDTLPSGVTIIAISPDGWTCPSTPITGTFSCTKDTVSGNEDDTLTFTATAPSDTIGAITNNVMITKGTETTGPTSSATVTVDGASLNISLFEPSGSTAPVGGIIYYGITVKNTSLSDEENLTITDDFSAIGSGYTLNSISDSDGWNCNGTTLLTCTRDSLSSGSSTTIYFSVNVPTSASLGVVTNEANVTTDTIPNPTASDTASTTIVGADLSISKSVSPTSVGLGEDATYTITVTNNGEANATNTTVSDIIPDDFTNISTSGCNNDGSSVSGQTVQCELGTLSNGDTKTFTISVTAPDTSGTYTNSATTHTDTPESITSNNTDTADLIVKGPDLVPAIDAPDYVAGNSKFTYTVSVANISTYASAYGATITDTIPSNVTYISGSLNTIDSNWNCSISGSTITCQTDQSDYEITSGYNQQIFSFEVQAGDAPDTITNSATVSTTTSEMNTANNTATAITHVEYIDLQVRKLVNGTDYGESENYLGIGDDITYTLQVKNGSLKDLNITDTNVTDYLPEDYNITDISITPSSKFDCSTSPWRPMHIVLGGDTLVCTLKDGDVITNTDGWVTVATITAKVIDKYHFDTSNENNNLVINHYKAETTLCDGDLTNNVPIGNKITKTLVRGANMSIKKTAPNPVGVGKEFNYLLHVANYPRDSVAPHDIPSTTAENITVTDDLPSNATFISASGTNWSCNESSGVLTCDYSGEMDPGESSDITVTVKAPCINALTITNEANVTNSTPELDRLVTADNNSSVDTVTAGANLVFHAISEYKDPVGAYKHEVYYVYIDNTGLADAHDINVTFHLTNPPNGSTWSNVYGHSADGWNCQTYDAASETITCHLDELNASETDSLFYIEADAPNYNGEIEINATLIGSDCSGSTSGYTKTLHTEIQGADVVVKKYANDPDPANPNNAIYYDDTINVGPNKEVRFKLSSSNNALGIAKNINISDTLPSGFTNIQIVDSGNWSCSINGQTVECSLDELDSKKVADDIIYSALSPTTIGTYTNTADINVTNTVETNTSNNSDSVDVVTKNCDIDASMSASKTKLKLNETFAYTVDLSNDSPVEANNITVTDTLPNGFTFVDSHNSDSGWSCSASGQQVTCTYPNLEAYGDTTRVYMYVQAPSDTTGTFSNDANISSDSLQNDINVSAPDVEVISSDIAVHIYASPSVVISDRNVTYTLNIQDINISTAYNIQIDQNFSSPVEALYITDDGGASCSIIDGQKVECSIDSLEYNDELNITVVATMTTEDDVIDPLTSTLTASTITLEEDLSNNKDSIGIRVTPLKPVVKYKMDECSWNGTAGEVIDSTSGLNGTAHNGANTINRIYAEDSTTGFAPPGRSGVFDGNDDYIDVNDNEKLHTIQNQTICMWLKSDDFSKRTNPIDKSFAGEGAITLENGTVDADGDSHKEAQASLTYYYGIAGGENAGSVSSSKYQAFNSQTKIAADEWTHVCIVRDFDAMKLRWYFNGNLVKEGSCTFDHATESDENLRIGDGYAGAYSGGLDEVEIYDFALDDMSIQQIYNNEKGGKEDNGTVRDNVTCPVDLKVEKTASPSNKVGVESSLIYTIKVTNISREPLTTGFTLQDIMPDGLTIVEQNQSIDISCSGAYDFNCTLDDSSILKQNESKEINITTITPNIDAKILSNSVFVTTGTAGTTGQKDIDMSNNDDNVTVTTVGADLSITKTAEIDDDNTSNVIHYTITVTNLSSYSKAKNVVLTDVYDSRLSVLTYPSGISCNIPVGANRFTCDLPDIDPGTTVSYITTMQATNGDDIINTASVSSTTAEYDLSNNSSSVSVNIHVGEENATVKLKDGFREHVSVNNYGNMVAIGNTILKAENQDGNTSLADLNTSYVNVSSAAINSSEAELKIDLDNMCNPTGNPKIHPQYTIEYAGLYWGGHIKGKDENDTLDGTFNTVILTTPHGTYSIAAGDQNDGNLAIDDNITGFYKYKKDENNTGRLFYTCTADITSIIKDEFKTYGDINGIYKVSDMNVSYGYDTPVLAPGVDDWEYTVSGFFGGWELIVVYKVDHRNCRPVRYKNMTVFDGFKYLMPVSPGQVVSLDINLSGFLTPKTGSIESSLYSMVLAGDKTLPYESMSINDADGTPHLIKEDANNTDNIFNDTISLKYYDGTPINKNINELYNPGVDLDEFDLTSEYDDEGNCLSSPCYLSNSQTSTMINIKVKESSTPIEGTTIYPAQYAFVSMLGFNTQIYTPDFIDSYKECFKLKNPGDPTNEDWVPCSDPLPVIHRGSVLKYRITVINTGTDDAIDVKVTDHLPEELDFNGSCSSADDDVIVTNIYALPDGKVTSSNDIDSNYDDTLREISGACYDPSYDINQTAIDECIEDVKAILIDGNQTTPENTIPDGNGEAMNLIDPSYNGTTCSQDEQNRTTLEFDFGDFAKNSVAWIEFKTTINKKAALGSSFSNSASIDFTSQTLKDNGINNLQVQHTEGVDSGVVHFNWENIQANVKDQGRTSVGTKIAGQNFNLTIALDGVSDLDIDTNGTTNMIISNVKIVDPSGSEKQDISGQIVNTSAAVDANGLSWQANNAVYNDAAKVLGFKFDLTVTYNGYSETKHYPSDFPNISNHIYTGDVFAVRPKKYVIDLPGSTVVGGYSEIPSALSINLKAHAVNESGSDTADYDQTLIKNNTTTGWDISLDPTFSTNPNCISKSKFVMPNLTFANGLAQTTMGYIDVGVLKLDLIDQSWTSVDQSAGDCIPNSNLNTPNASGLVGCDIKNDQLSIVFAPYELKITSSDINDSNNGNFTYMISNPATDPIYGTIKVEIEARNMNHNITSFFSNTCFADDVTSMLKFDIQSKGLNNLQLSFINEHNLTDIHNETNLTSTDNTFSTKAYKNTFVNGKGKMNLRIFASGRNITTPQEPALMNSKDLNMSLNNYLGIAGLNLPPTHNNIAALHDIHFIYGRVHAPNYSSDNNTISAKIYYEGYCRDCNKSAFPSLGKESVDSIYWYENAQNGLADGNIITFVQPANSKISINPGVSTAITNGTETQTITYNGLSYPYSERVDIKPSNWLIYNPFDPNVSTNSFFVEFTKFKDWAGVGKQGKTVDLNISTKSSHRIAW